MISQSQHNRVAFTLWDNKDKIEPLKKNNDFPSHLSSLWGNNE